ncbi:MAG: bacillithiol biosynthesis cysteine-adding enzyme BshC [Candidatus Hydrogenedentes bacterium]|nr:bacillithiol biosynthesis cysteine-adding enzyme BshC [Candidatus Hydrogenedentota bacterium]
MSDLYTDYLNEHVALAPFYSAWPRSLFDQPLIEQAWDPSLVDALRTYQERLGAPKRLDGNEAVIITGQQPGLFTGPLYTIYKAITAIRIAEDLARLHGTPCIPIFWVGGEDHDFEEAREAFVLSKNHEPISYRYTPEADVQGLPMYRVPLEPSLHAMIDAMTDNVPGSEMREPVRAVLHETLGASDSLSDWTARLLAHLFRDTPLLVFSPHLTEARRCALPVMEQAIAEPLAGTRLLNEAGTKLGALGYDAQVVKGAEDCTFFLEVDCQRRKVTYDGMSFHIGETDLRYSVDELLAILKTAPERFSPNVALRCVVQQHLFPVAAYVAGPGEIAYWGQLRGFFAHYEQPMPVVYPRARCVLSSIKLNKLMRKLGLELSDLSRDQESVLEKALVSGSRGAVLDRFHTYRSQIESTLGSMEREMNAGTATTSLRERVVQELDRCERALLRADEAVLEATRGQVLRVCHALAPWRRPQERVYTVFSYLFEHGAELIAHLTREMDVTSFTLNEIEL